MDQPVWEVSGDHVHRSFRKLSLCCHPDKSSHPDAPRAFEALKKAKACLADPTLRDDYLHEFVRQLKTSWEGNWASKEAASDSKQRVSSMREEAKRAEAEQVVDAMRERRERVEAAARKKQRIAAAQQRRAAQHEAGAVDDDDDDSGGDDGSGHVGGGRAAGGGTGPIRSRPGAGAARKRPKFL